MTDYSLHSNAELADMIIEDNADNIIGSDEEPRDDMEPLEDMYMDEGDEEVRQVDDETGGDYDIGGDMDNYDIDEDMEDESDFFEDDEVE